MIQFFNNMMCIYMYYHNTIIILYARTVYNKLKQSNFIKKKIQTKYILLKYHIFYINYKTRYFLFSLTFSPIHIITS